MSVSFFVDSGGAYKSQCDTAHGKSQGWVEVPSSPADYRQVWDFTSETWSPAPKVVPDAIDALDGLLTLDAAGLSAAYQEWADDPARTFAERAFLTKAMVWRREDPTIAVAAAALGLTSEQVDDLFIEAAKR